MRCKSLKVGWRCVGFYVWCLAGIYSDRTQESPTLDLANDCSRFVTGYFEIIRTSSPHIYHSALVSAPKNSMVWNLYQQHAHPFTRVVHGGPVSWPTNITSTTCPSQIDLATWSSCNRFIAIAYKDAMKVDLLDSLTLQQLQTLELSQSSYAAGRALAFSPDSRVLTLSGTTFGSSGRLSVVSWDLQTGGAASVIREGRTPREFNSGTPIAHSANGKMIRISRSCPNQLYLYDVKISIFDVASGSRVCSHSLPGCSPLPGGIWTHGDSLRFATTTRDGRAITIREVGFPWNAAPTEVETLPIPGSDGQGCALELRLLYTPCRLALAFDDEVQIWDVRNSKYLLQFEDAELCPNLSFSSDGRFFACQTTSRVYLWRESPTGYILHKTFSSSAVYSGPLFSPDGESIVIFGGRTIQLWHTRGSTSTPSGILTQAPQQIEDFVLDFSSDGTIVAAARQKGDAVTILDLESGILRSTTNVGMEVYGLGVIGNIVIVIGDKKVTRWVLPAGNCSRVDLEDGCQTTDLLDPPHRDGSVLHGSVSPNSDYIAIITGLDISRCLKIHCANTGGRLRVEKARFLVGRKVVSWFAPGGGSFWCADEQGEATEWKVVNNRKVLELSLTEVSLEDPPAGYPWASSRGYRVTEDWWICGPDGKRLLMLPPLWRSNAARRMWKGQFLALVHRELSEPVILELLNS